MRIDRDNYEKFFLLYVDNELTAHEKTAVENFVNQNSDLAKELEMLQQSTLSDNTIEFTNKEFLYKKDKGISLANYEEYFVLAADNELNEQEITQVEEFVLKHPQLQSEFMLLHQSKLKPEAITFNGKKKLYRYQTERRLIPLTWMRMSAAAAIIGILITNAVSVRNTENNNNSTVLSNPDNKIISEKNNKSLVQKTVTEKPFDTLHVKTQTTSNLKSVSTVSQKSKKAGLRKVTEAKNDEKSFVVSPKKTTVKLQDRIETDSLEIEKPAIAEQKPPASRQIKTAPVDDSNNSNTANKRLHNEPDYTFVKQSVSEEKPILTSHAVYLETDNDEEEQTLYVGSAEINKNKLKGLFKKVSTFIDKKIRQKKD